MDLMADPTGALQLHREKCKKQNPGSLIRFPACNLLLNNIWGMRSPEGRAKRKLCFIIRGSRGWLFEEVSHVQNRERLETAWALVCWRPWRPWWRQCSHSGSSSWALTTRSPVSHQTWTCSLREPAGVHGRWASSCWCEQTKTQQIREVSKRRLTHLG